MTIKEYKLTEGSVLKNIIFLSLPMMLTLLLQDAFNLVDMYFVGNLGSSATAAVSMSGIIVGLILTAVTGLSFGTLAMISRYVGEGNIEKADNVVMQSFILGLIITLIITPLGYIFAPQMLELLGASKEVVMQGTPYLRITFGGSITIFLTVLMFSALRGAGDPISPMIILLISTILNIILDPIMIYGLFGFPRWGVAGSAAATIVARAIAMIMVLFVMMQEKSIIKLRARDFRFDFNIMKEIIRIGNPSSIELLILNLSTLFLMKIVASFGTTAVAAYGIGMRLNMAVTIPTMGFGFAAATLVGQNLGARKPDRAEKSGWICAGIGTIIMIILTIVFLIFSGNIVSVFNDEFEVVEIGTQFIKTMAPTFIFLGLGTTLGRGLNGAGDTVYPMIISIITMLALRIPLAWYMSTRAGTAGIWKSLALTNAIYGIVITMWFKIGKWKEKEI
ncbi:MAG: MATE family efflux transporter [Candidatus Humimicrobiaceae bacterium]|jgi:putative MATE family efflux protein|nr:MATE family efflux transporter [Candidatus Humimicrobiaceae bacterium]